LGARSAFLTVCSAASIVLRVIEDERADLGGHTLDGRYRIGRRIGIGGTGVVFEAANLRDHGTVAIKTLRPCFVEHPDLGRRLRREAEVARRVRHPGVVPTLDEGTLSDGSPYIVMPYLRGESMSRLLLRKTALPVDTVAALVSRMAAILHASHCAGYVHRDVKPEHLLLEPSESGDLVAYLLDFGVCSSEAAPADERERERGKVFGTPSYVSPEQAAGEVDIDGRADLFSLGVLAFEALSGRLPFSGSTVSKLLLRIIREDAPRLSDVMPKVDPAIDDIVARMLARDPNDRFPSARAVARALAPHVGDRKLVERRIASALKTGTQTASSTPTARPTGAMQNVA
jgi:serine/threonine-protein kinase